MANSRETCATALLVLVILHYSSLPLVAASAAVVSPSPVCAGSRAPFMLPAPLPFCGNAGYSCCDPVDDAELRRQLQTMNIADAACGAIVKAFLCTRCIPSPSAALVNMTDPKQLSVPLLCASTPASASAHRHPLRTSRSPPGAQATMCLERVSAAAYVSMAAHPDGSGRVFLSSRDGNIWLASMPKLGSGGAALRVAVDDEGRALPFLDLTDRVHHDAFLGLVGVAFHPEFATNGRFFVSYNCDSRVSPDCGGSGRCWGAASAAVGNGSRPCRYQLVVAEFSARRDGAVDFSKATRANSSEVKRILTLGLREPHYSYQQHGGQILLRPSDDGDEYLYVITGYGDFSKERRSLFGKIIRFYVGRRRMPGESGPASGRATPAVGKAELVAVGLNNPSGCSFDSERPSDLYCANTDQQQLERVYRVMISKDPRNYDAAASSAVSLVIINHIRPAASRMPSIVGGLLYRGSADPSLKGRYLYIYGSDVWTGVLAPAEGNKTNRSYGSTQIPTIRCSGSSPMPCRREGSIIGIVGRVLSWGEDNNKDVFILATGGVYRVVPPGLCGGATPPLGQPPGTGWLMSFGLFALVFAVYSVWSAIFGGGAQPTFSCCNGGCGNRVINYYARVDDQHEA